VKRLLPAVAAALVMAGVATWALDGPAANVYYDPAKPHHTPQGFRNNYPHAPPQGFWQWQWERWTQGVPQVPPGGWTFPLDRPDVEWLRANRTAATVTWIGHATALIQVAGVNILTDPVFGDRASPVSFAGPQRWVPPAIGLGDLPHIDVVLLSHNHYDHLDEDSVRALAAQPGGPPRFYVPLGVDAWFKARDLPVHATMDWWDRVDDGGLAVHLVPAQHWSARSWWDRNETLWGGFVVEAPGFRFIYTGDTGYSRDFADIGRRFGGFDLALIPVGSYAPRWFMAAQHVDPPEAVQIHRDLGAKTSLGVHWGTFALTDEPLDEPPAKLREAVAAAGLPPEAFEVWRHGETRRFAAATIRGATAEADSPMPPSNRQASSIRPMVR
jgi:L-ascorbate metabolism protein UlaG (beta-lactamase superfamily)